MLAHRRRRQPGRVGEFPGPPGADAKDASGSPSSGGIAREPRTWSVSGSGPADFKSLQPAINAARPGDVIEVLDAFAYEGPFVIADADSYCRLVSSLPRRLGPWPAGLGRSVGRGRRRLVSAGRLHSAGEPAGHQARPGRQGNEDARPAARERLHLVYDVPGLAVSQPLPDVTGPRRRMRLPSAR